MTIGEACSELGERQPVKPSHACLNCGSDDLAWAEEYRGPYLDPNGTGYDIEFCNECGEPTGERKWVGH